MEEPCRADADPRTDSPYILKISSFLRSNKRTVGLSAAFTRVKERMAAPLICPYIETFNVVPHNSKIIQYVSQNNVRGVQRLFDLGEASPLDVDPFGISLLSVSGPSHK